MTVVGKNGIVLNATSEGLTAAPMKEVIGELW
jgi:hypothetical protein